MFQFSFTQKINYQEKFWLENDIVNILTVFFQLEFSLVIYCLGKRTETTYFCLISLWSSRRYWSGFSLADHSVSLSDIYL